MLKELKQRLGESNIVIAPDRFTVSVERGIISSLNLESSFGIDVMSFTRLADKLVGKDIKKCLTPEGSVMLIAKVISDNRNKLEYYNKVALAEGFASELYAALTAIRNSGISTDMLRENVSKMTPALRAKTNDIILIYDGYLDALSGRHSDSSTRLYALANYIKEHPESVAATNFYCTDIYEFSAPELEIITALSKNALSLTMGFTSGYNNPNMRIYPDRVISRLQAVCKDKIEIERNDEKLAPAVDAISRGLFSYIGTDSPVENGGKVKLRCAKDRADEVLSLALDVIEKVRAGGRYKDIEMFVSDIEDYQAQIKAVFSRYGIPFFIDKKELLQEQTKVRYILDAIACVRSGYRRREVLDFVKNPLFAHSVEGGADSIFLFENYVLKYNIDHSRFNSEFVLKDDVYRTKHKLSNTKHNNKIAVDENVIPEQVRKVLCKTLSYLDIRGERNIGDFVQSSRVFLKDADDAWRSHVESLAELSEFYRKCAEQVDRKIEAVLEEIGDVLDFDTDIKGYESIFKSMLKTLKIALVPTYLDCVFVGDADSRFMGLGDVYILGATNDKLPRTSAGGAVVSPKDEEYFAKLGLDITPNERQKLLIEKYFVCDLMKKAQGKVIVSYPETGVGGVMRPATVIFELKSLLNEDGKPIETERVNLENLSDLGEQKYSEASKLFSTEKSSYFEVLRNVISHRAPLKENEVYGSAYASMAESDRERLNRIFDVPERISLPSNAYFAESTSVSRLETFFLCPYSHYFNYILSLRKRKDGSAEGTENGTVLHYVLERFFTDIRDGVINSKEDIKPKAYEYFDGAIKENGFEVLLEKSDTGRLLRRVREEGVRVCEDLYGVYLRSSFKPALLEAKIGEGKIKPMSLKVGDKTVHLKGTIDRVDMFDDKFAIVDYKTYKSADLTLKELYYGQKIQLYIYMRAVEQSLDMAPVGVFYLPIFAGFTDDSVSRYKFKGQVSESAEIMLLLDSVVKDNPQKSVIPYKTNTKGELNPEVHLTRQGFDMLADYAIELATRGAGEIASGYVKPAPVKDACKKCRYLEICSYKELGERKTAKATLSSFDTSYGTKEEE